MRGVGETEGELFLRARGGDADAWSVLVDRIGPRVFAVARAYRLSYADAQDVFQVAFYRLVTHMDSIREPERVGAWLKSTARHESLRVLKRNGRQVPTGDDDELDVPDPLAPQPEDRLVADERQIAVWDAIGALPPHCQRLLRLLMTDPPPTYDEVTIALDMRQGSIGPTRRRCLDKLKDRLAGINEDEEGSARQEDPDEPAQ